MGHPADETELGRLLVLMLGANQSFRTLRGEGRVWHHHERSHEAFTRQNERRDGSSQMMIAFSSSADADESQAPEPVTTEDHVRLWLARPDRLREERVRAHLGAGGKSVLVQVGDTWWSFDPRLGAMTNGGAPDHQHGSDLVQALLDPAQLLASRELVVVGHTVHAGRPAVCIESKPRPLDAFLQGAGRSFGDWPQELVVDVERGILLRSASLLDGEPFAITEFLSIAFDEEISEEAFVFVPPPGEEVRDAREALHGLTRAVPLHEAAGQAAFCIFVPALVPEDWRMRVLVFEGDERRGWPSNINIHFSDPMSRLNVNLNEQAVGDGCLPDKAPDGGDWRVEHAGGRELRLWEPAGADQGMPRIALLEISGTRIQISADNLDADAIVEIAANLVPAPTEPPALSA